MTITRLPGLGVGEEPLEHAHVVAQRRVDVAVGEDHRVAARRRAPCTISAMRMQSSAAACRRRLAGPHAVGQADRRQRPQQVARVERDVVRLEHVPAGRVERVASSAPASGAARGRPSCRPGARRRRARTAAPARGRRPCCRRRSRRSRVGFRARIENSRGASAACARRKPGSKRTVVARRPSGPPRGRARARVDGRTARRPRRRAARRRRRASPARPPTAARTAAPGSGSRALSQLATDTCRSSETTIGVFRDRRVTRRPGRVTRHAARRVRQPAGGRTPRPRPSEAASAPARDPAAAPRRRP